MLAPRELALRLVERGLIAPRTLHHGSVTFGEASRRNANVAVTRRGTPLLFVKQPCDAGGAVDHEARVYTILTRHASLAGMVPSLRHHERGILVLSAVRGETLAARATRGRGIPIQTARDLGRALAMLHESRASLPGSTDPPWVLSLAAPPIGIVRRASAASLEMLRIIQSSPEICRGLATLRDEWRADTPLHNDLRLENVLLERRRARRLKLIDWELAAMGDAAWDAGSIIASLLALWLFSLRSLPGMSVQRLARSAAIPMPRVRAATREFWASYAAARTARAGSEDRTRAIRYAAARLLHLSWERTIAARAPGAEVICAIQAAANLFDDPDSAASHFLGARRRARRG